MIEPIKRSKLVACIRFDNLGAGFALPIFQSEGIDKFFVQEIDELSDTISSFRFLSDVPSNLIWIDNGPIAQVGEAQLYTFQSDDGSLQVGQLADLQSFLRKFIEKFPERSSVNLQIVELVGTPDEKKNARLKMKEEISHRTGSAAGHGFYAGSVLRQAVWRQLISNAKTEDAARKILRERHRLSVGISASGDITIDLAQVDLEQCLSVPLETLLGDLRYEYISMAPPLDTEASSAHSRLPWSTEYDSEVISQPLIPGILSPDAVSLMLAAISRASRQEERLALLLYALVSDREVGKRVLTLYKSDRAKHARLVVLNLREVLGLDDLPKTGQLPHSANREVVSTLGLVEIVWAPYGRRMPWNREFLLFYLAQYLSGVAEIRSFVQRRLDETRSIFADPVRHRIQSLLDNPQPIDPTA